MLALYMENGEYQPYMTPPNVLQHKTNLESDRIFSPKNIIYVSVYPPCFRNWRRPWSWTISSSSLPMIWGLPRVRGFGAMLKNSLLRRIWLTLGLTAVVVVCFSQNLRSIRRQLAHGWLPTYDPCSWAVNPKALLLLPFEELDSLRAGCHESMALYHLH